MSGSAFGSGPATWDGRPRCQPAFRGGDVVSAQLTQRSVRAGQPRRPANERPSPIGDDLSMTTQVPATTSTASS